MPTAQDRHFGKQTAKSFVESRKRKNKTKPNPEFKASEDTKKTLLKDDDPSKVTQIGVGLDSA